MASQEFLPDEPRISMSELLECEDILLLLLIQRIGQLSPGQRRTLAMYYYENLPLPEIAAWFGLTEHQIEKIRVEAVDLLREYFLTLSTKHVRDSGTPTAAFPLPENFADRVDQPGIFFDASEQ
jgi:predicted DNA-binding protein YlxM (UPF0122 family)